MALFIEHVNVVLQRLRQDPITVLSTDTTSVAYRAQVAVQRAIARVWNAKQWTFKQRSTTLALSDTGSREFILPKDVGEPYLISIDQSPWTVRRMGKDEFRQRIPNPIETGRPRVYTLFEYVGVEDQPSSASFLSVSSSSTSDTTQQVRIRGVVNGQEDAEDVSLNGTTAVLTTKSFTSVYSISKSAATAGRITITSNSGSVTILTMGPLEKVLRLKIASFYPRPTVALTATIEHFKLPFIPTSALDDSEIPSRWDYVVEQWAFALALQPQGQDQLQEQTVQFQLGQAMLDTDMASEESQSADTLIRPNRGLDDGAYYPNYIASEEDGLQFESGY